MTKMARMGPDSIVPQHRTGCQFLCVPACLSRPARYCAAVSQENVDKARDFIDAYNRRDFDAAVACFDPEIEWVLPARQSSDSGRGPEEVKRFWKGLDETFEELRLEPQEFVDAGDHVATRLRHYGRGKLSGLEIEEEMTTKSSLSAMERWCESSTSANGPRPSKPRDWAPRAACPRAGRA